MKKLFVLTFAATFSVLNCAHTIQDHIGPMQHQKLTPADGAWYLLRNLRQTSITTTCAELAALPENQRLGQFLPVSILVGNRYTTVRLPIGRYLNLMLQFKQITPTAEQQTELDRLVYGRPPERPLLDIMHKAR